MSFVYLKCHCFFNNWFRQLLFRQLLFHFTENFLRRRPPLSFNVMNSKLRIRTTWMWLTVVGAVDMCGVSILSDSYSREYRSLGYYLINRCKKYTTWYEYTTFYHSNPSLSNPSWRVTRQCWNTLPSWTVKVSGWWLRTRVMMRT